MECRDPDRVALAYTEDSVWRNRGEFPIGRELIRKFLARKWDRELDYRLMKELWGFRTTGSRYGFSMNGTTTRGNWFRSYGNELWEFDERGLMPAARRASTTCRSLNPRHKFFWPAPGPRPADHPGIPGVE